MKFLSVVPCNTSKSILVMIFIISSNFFLPRVDICPEKFKHRYNRTRVYREGIFTRNAAQSVLSGLSAEDFQKCYTLKLPNVSAHYGPVQCSHNSIHIAGIFNVLL